MNDILFYNNYVAAADIITIALSVLIFFLLRSSYVVKKRNLNVFYLGTFFLLLAANANIIYHQMILNITAVNVIGIYIARAVSYSALFWTYVCFLAYIRNLVNMRSSYRKVFYFTIHGVAVFGTLWEFVSPFLQKGFYIDENLAIHQNYYQDIFRYLYSYFSLSVIILLIAYRKKFVGKMFKCIVGVMTLSFSLMVYQDTMMQTTYICISFVFPILAVLFLYHHNSYEVETGMLDHQAFEAYIQDTHQKKLSMIFLNFPELNHEKLSEMSGKLFQLTDRYMMYSCTFRLRDNKMVMIYEKERNKNYEQSLGALFDNFISILPEFILMIRLTDILDIIIVAYLFYKLSALVRETRAGTLIKGIILLIIFTWISNLLQLTIINYLLKNLMQFGIMAFLIVFQPELRRALEKVGRTNFSSWISGDQDYVEVVASEIASAAAAISSRRIGALIVIERGTKIGDIIRTGAVINSDVSSELLINMFIPNTPLHDGAVIIRENKIVAARCILPLTHNETLSREFGTRHRAALGLSESSDAAVIVVSEETGKISFALNGNMSRNYTEETLKKVILKVLSPEPKAVNNITLYNKIKERLKWKN